MEMEAMGPMGMKTATELGQEANERENNETLRNLVRCACFSSKVCVL